MRLLHYLNEHIVNCINMSSDESECDENSISNNDSNNDSDNKVKTDNLIKLFTKKELCYYRMINKFFIDCNKSDIIKMIDIINGKSEISLRVLDWFVTKYSKKRIGVCVNKENKETEVFDIRISYKSQLKAFKKRYFDPFRRRKKFKYNYDSNEYINTTIGQLNFFKWAISNNIIKYVEDNLIQINKAMNISNKEDKTRKKKNNCDTASNEIIKPIKKEKNNVKINAVKTIKQDEVEIVLTFD